MALERSYARALQLSLFKREAPYGTPPAVSAATYASMSDFGEGVMVEFDDLVQGDTDVITGREMQTRAEIARQSCRLTYEEPRVKPNTLASMLSLALGTVAATQDGALAAYRHKITKAASTSLLSMAGHFKFEAGDERAIPGLKADSFTLAINGPYFSLSVPLIGSGKRDTSSVTFQPVIAESWMRQGDAKFFWKDIVAPIAIPVAPTQGSANLGGSEVNVSTNVRSFSLNWGNALAADAGYRASTGLLRGNFHPVRRTSTFTIVFDVEGTREAADLDRYLLQKTFAFEVNIDSGSIIAATGAFKYGAILIIPQARLTPISRTQEDQFEVLSYTGTIEDDKTNSELVGFVYTAPAAYLVA